MFRLGNKFSVIYPSYEMFFSGKSDRKFSTEEANKAEKFQGDISHRSAIKIKRVIEVWNDAIEQEMKRIRQPITFKWKYITFVTLTLSAKQQHSDNEIKRKCLNTFLIQSRRQFGIKNYLWRAEPQKNGNIHFHILFDRAVNYEKIRDCWNGCQESLSYVSNFEKKHGHRSPNSTDIHSLRNVQDIAEYVGKYMMKEQGAREIEGRLWSCNRELKIVKPYGGLVDAEIMSVIDYGEKMGYLEGKKKDYAVIIIGKLKGLLQHYSAFHRERMRRHNQTNFDYLYHGKDMINYEDIPLLPGECVQENQQEERKESRREVKQLDFSFNS